MENKDWTKRSTWYKSIRPDVGLLFPLALLGFAAYYHAWLSVIVLAVILLLSAVLGIEIHLRQYRREHG